jgi:hypothetical protein
MLHRSADSEDSGEYGGDSPDDSTVEDESEHLIHNNRGCVGDLTFVSRALKASLFFCSVKLVGYGSIMLVPALIRRHNKENALGDLGPCAEVVHGSEFLIVAAVTGGANVLGRFAGYFLRSYVKFIPLMSITAAVVAISYGTVLAKPGLIVESVLIGVAKFCYSIQSGECVILKLDEDYWGLANMSLGGALMEGFGQIGAIIGSSLAVFIDPYIAVTVSSIIAVFGIGIACSINK